MIKYQKAYVIGRMAGSHYIIGKATKLLTKAYPPFVGILSGLGNFGAVSFGTAILATAKGYTRAEDIVLSMMTGEAQRAPVINTGNNKQEGNATIKLFERYVEIMEEANDYNPEIPTSMRIGVHKTQSLQKRLVFANEFFKALVYTEY